MRRILLISIIVLSILTLFLGCSNSEPQQDTPTNLQTAEKSIDSEINSDYYDEGIRLLNQYCTESVINDNYQKISALTRQELMNNDTLNKKFQAIRKVAGEYVSRATNSYETIYSERVASLMIQSYIVPISLYNKEDAAINDKDNISAFASEINDYYKSLSNLMEAKTIESLEEIPVKLTP